jgi:type I restriction enzyme S subunit
MSVEGWETVCLSDIATIIDCPHSTPKWTELGYFVIRNWNVRNGRLNSDRASYTDKKHFLERIRRSQPEFEDLVLTREAPMGEVCMIPDGLECCLGQRVVLLKANHQVVNPAFLLFSIQSPFVKNQINSHEGTGFTVSNLRIPAIANLEVPLPPLPIQTRIAAILSALDDKIELNRQTNATLEAIAQAIFKEWFVDFRYPGATGEMQDVGTGGMNWAGLEPAPTHLIPKRWRVGRLGEICELAYGKGLKSDMRVKGECPVVGSNGVVGTHNEYLVQGPGIVIGRKGTIGQVTWLHDNFFPIGTTFYIKDQLAVKGLYFHYFLLKGQDFKKIGSDSAVPGLNRNQAHDNLVIIPSKGVI